MRWRQYNIHSFHERQQHSFFMDPNVPRGFITNVQYNATIYNSYALYCNMTRKSSQERYYNNNVNPIMASLQFTNHHLLPPNWPINSSFFLSTTQQCVFNIFSQSHIIVHQVLPPYAIIYFTLPLPALGPSPFYAHQIICFCKSCNQFNSSTKSLLQWQLLINNAIYDSIFMTQFLWLNFYDSIFMTQFFYAIYKLSS